MLNIGRRITELLRLLLVAVFWFTAAAPQVQASGVEPLLVLEPTSEYPRRSEGDVIELKDGRLCLVYTRFSGGGGDDGPADVVARTSGDGGRTWTDDRILIPNEGKCNVMSVSLVRLAGGEIGVFYLRKNDWSDVQMLVRRSSDELATLGEPVRVTVADGYHVVNNDRVVLLSSGRLIVPAALHPCPDGTRKTWSGRAIPVAYLSDDNGRTWRAGEPAPTPPGEKPVVLQEPGVVELKDGRLMMYIRTDQGTQYQCFSTDRGQTWSAPAPGPLASPLSPATIERIPWSGELLAVWNDHSGWHAFPAGKRTPLCIATSRDDGRTWSPSRVIEGDPNGWYCYTSMTCIEDRLILSYCAGDPKVGRLSRLKVLALSRDWLDGPK